MAAVSASRLGIVNKTRYRTDRVVPKSLKLLYYFIVMTTVRFIPGTTSKIALSAVRVRQVSARTGALTWQSSWYIVKVSV